MEMAGPKFTILTIFYKIVVFLITTRVINSDESPSCTYDCAAPFIPGAVAYWPMTSETKGEDISGNENHAKCVGLNYTDGPTGEYNGAAYFNGSSNSYAKVTNSLSMDVGKYAGFSFSGYIRYLGIQNTTASLIDWSGMKGYGVYITASKLIIQLHLYPEVADTHKAEFSTDKLTRGAWHFIGVSYEKATGRASLYKDGQLDVKEVDKNIAAGSGKTREVGIGIDLSDKTKYNYKGDMNCMMLFQYALTADDFGNVMEFCRTTNSTQTMLPNITVSNITATRATASWTVSPGIFSGYSIAIERKHVERDLEIVRPNSISSSVSYPKSVLTHMVPGATYRVRVLHMQGTIEGRARYSAWFDTEQYPVVESDSIIFTEITDTSAKVSWKDATGNYDAYTVDISPTIGGAKADPSTVPRGTTATFLKNVLPGSRYIIAIRTKIGSGTSAPSMTIFQTKQLVPVETASISISEVTTTSAVVTWKEAKGYFDGYLVDISPNTGGAKVDPSIVPRGATSTSVKNLAKETQYTITITTIIGSRRSSPSMKSFQTLDPVKATNAIALSAVTVGSFVIAVISIALIVRWKRLWRKKKRNDGNLTKRLIKGYDNVLLEEVRSGKTEHLKRLLDSEHDINTTRDEDGNTALQYAATEGNIDIMQMLLKAGADPNIKNEAGDAPLHAAVAKNHRRATDLLIKSNANVDTRNQNECTPLYLAARMGYVGVMEILLRNGANINAKRDDGSSPLHIAIDMRRVEAVKLLLKKDADISQGRKSGTTPLHIAASRGGMEICEIIVNQPGVNVNVTNQHKATPLHSAAAQNQCDTMGLLLDKGADIEAMTEDGSTPLFTAAHKGHEEAAELLIKKGAAINATKHDGSTALVTAIINNKFEVVEALLKLKARTDWTYGEHGDTVLHEAAKRGNLKIVKCLIKNGAVFIKNKENKTPADVATNPEIKEILKNFRQE